MVRVTRVQLENHGTGVGSLRGITPRCNVHPPQIEGVHFDRWSKCCLVSPLYRGRFSPMRISILREDMWRAATCHDPHSTFSFPLSKYLTSFLRLFPNTWFPQNRKTWMFLTEAVALPAVPPSKPVSFIPCKKLTISLSYLDLRPLGALCTFWGEQHPPLKCKTDFTEKQTKAMLKKPPLASDHKE